jgi:glycerophosphoryl diester phosphodiesterase
MNSKNFIWYALPMMGLLLVMWLYEPWFYQRYIASTNIENIKKKDFKIIGHKGAAGYAPENTLASLQVALDLGVDMIEIDVHMTKDEEVVVFHDEDISRTTNGTGKIHELTLAEVKELDAGSWFDAKFAGEQVPTLREAINLVHGKADILIDIKSKGHEFYDNFAEIIVDIIDEKEDNKEWCIVQSYEQEYLEHAYTRDSTIKMKKLMMGEDESMLFSFYLNSKSFMTNRNKHQFFETINPHYSTLSQRRIFRLHAKGYKVHTYVVNEPIEMIKMLNMAVDGIITDYPDRLIKIRTDIRKIHSDRDKKETEEN